MKTLFLSIVLLSISKWNFNLVHAQDGQEAQAESGSAAAGNDPAQYERFKKQVCGLIDESSRAESFGKWSNVLTEEEIIRLAYTNMIYGLQSDAVSHLQSELGWKKNVIDTLSLITKATCTDDVIVESFLNAAKNLFLDYLNRIPAETPSEGAAPVGEGEAAAAEGGSANDTKVEQWSSIVKSLQVCASNVAPIHIQSSCGKALTFSGKDGRTIPIAPVIEQFDKELGEGGDLIGLDVIIDTVWWMFSTTYARCYAYFYPNEDEMLLFFQMFREDFLEIVAERWRAAGPLTIHFPIVFGPYDSDMAADNTRKCATAAFQYEGLAERQLVRPVNVILGNTVERNFKLVAG